MSAYSCVDAIEFIGQTFNLSKKFKDELKSSQRPNIILIVGPARSGKSTLANILLSPTLNQQNDTFKTDEGNVPVTKQIQYCKIKLSTICQIHHLNIQLDFDSDLFILDCEGIDSLDEITVSLRKAIFSLLQISSVNLFVTKNIDRSNIFDLKSFFSLSQLIPGTQQKLNKVSAIVLTDIGVPGHPSEENYEEIRKENDSKELTKFLSYLTDHHINFTKENTAFFAQPKWKNEKHYFESIKDLIHFIVSGISNRMPIPGQNLIEIFDKIVPIISSINELDDLDVRLEVIVQNLIHNYFQISCDKALQILPNLIQEKISNKTARQLINMANRNYYNEIQRIIIQSFKQEANMKFENIIDLFAEKSNEFVNIIKSTVKQQATNAYVKICKSIVITFVYDQVVDSMKQKIMTFFNNQNSASLRIINQTQLTDKFKRDAKNSYYQQINAVCHALTSTRKFISKIDQLQTFVSNEVESNKNRRFLECPPFPKNLEEARKAGQNGNQVIIWPYGANGKNATFNVVKNKLTIPGLVSYWIDKETKDGMKWMMYEEKYSLNVEIDINSMVIKPAKKYLRYWERSYKNSIFGSTHHRYHFQTIFISLKKPFCFENDLYKYTISSSDGPKTVPPIAFKII